MLVQYSTTYNLAPLANAAVTHNGTAPSVPAPTNLRQTATTSSTISLAWDAVAGTYTLQRAPVDSQGVVGQYATVYTGTAKSYTDGPLSFGVTYVWRVSVAVNGASSSPSLTYQYTVGAKRKVLVIKRGDSITRADGAAVAAGFRSADQYDAANSAQMAQGAKANEGRQTSVEKAVDLLNAQFGTTHEFTALPLGYPSMTSFWYGRNHLNTAYQGIDLTPCDEVIEISAWLANDATQPDSTHTPTDSTAPADIAAEVRRHMQVLKVANSKTKAIISLPPNRDNYPAYVNFKVARAQFINLICADNTFDEVADIRTQPVGQDIAPTSYASNNNTPNIFFYDQAGHLNGNGTTQQALVEAQAIARLEGLTLSQGNGTRPTAQPAATLTISPASGNSAATRTATLTTSITPTQVRFFQVNPQGLTYAPTLLGTDSTAPFTATFTPGTTGNYYAELTNPDNTLAYTYPLATATVTGVSPTTRTADFTTRQINFTKQADGTLLKTGGPDNAHAAQATASVYIPATSDNILLEFTMPPLNGAPGGGADFLLGFGLQPVPIDGSDTSITTISKVSFYANDTVGRVFLVVNGGAGAAGPDFNRPAPGDKIQMEKRADGYYFTNVTDPQNPISYPSVPASGQTGGVPTSYLTTPHYISAVGALTGLSRVPVVTITATQFSFI